MLRLVVVVSVLLAVPGSAFALPDGGAGVGGDLSWSLRGPVRIESDSDFEAYRGWISGSGLPSDPYVIEKASIGRAAAADSANAGIYLRNTTRHVVIRGVLVRAESSHTWNAVAFWNASNIRVYSAVTESLILVIDSRDIAFVANEIRSGLRVLRSSNVTISANQFPAYRYGRAIYASDSTDVRAVANTIVAPLGFTVTDSVRVEIVANRVSGVTDDAAQIEGSQDVLVAGNEFYGDPAAFAGSGVQALRVRNLMIRGNRLSEFSDPIYVIGSWHLPLEDRDRGVTIAHNVVAASRDWSIWVEWLSDVAIHGNQVRTSRGGIGLMTVFNGSISGNLVTETDDALGAYNVTKVAVSGNVLLEFVTPAAGYGTVAWNGSYPVGGNFWDTYVGEDQCYGPEQMLCTGPDGIGDAPFRVDETIEDRYPLMAPRALPDGPPIASLVIYPPLAVAGEPVALHAGSSYDPEDDRAALEARWDFDGDGIWDTFWSSTSLVRSFEALGHRLVRVEIRDSSGNVDAAEAFVLVVPRAGEQRIESAGLPVEASWVVVGLLAAGSAVLVLVRHRRRTRPPPTGGVR